MVHSVNKNDDPRLTLTYFTARQNGSPIRLKGGNCYKVIEWEKNCSKGLY